MIQLECTSPVPSLIPWVVAAALAGFLFNPVQAQIKTIETPVVQDSIPLPGAMGWSAFTQADQHNLELTDEQLLQLKKVDAGLESKYNSMGIEPWTSDKFPELNRQRIQAVQDILSPVQYQLWARPTTPVPATPPTIIPETAPMTK